MNKFGPLLYEWGLWIMLAFFVACMLTLLMGPCDSPKDIVNVYSWSVPDSGAE